MPHVRAIQLSSKMDSLRQELTKFNLEFLAEDLAKIKDIEKLISGPYGQRMLATMSFTKTYMNSSEEELKGKAKKGFENIGRLRQDFLERFSHLSKKYAFAGRPDFEMVTESVAWSLKKNRVRDKDGVFDFVQAAIELQFDCDPVTLLFNQFGMEVGLNLGAVIKVNKDNIGIHIVSVLQKNGSGEYDDYTEACETTLLLFQKDFVTVKDMWADKAKCNAKLMKLDKEIGQLGSQILRYESDINDIEILQKLVDAFNGDGSVSNGNKKTKKVNLSEARVELEKMKSRMELMEKEKEILDHPFGIYSKDEWVEKNQKDENGNECSLINYNKDDLFGLMITMIPAGFKLWTDEKKRVYFYKQYLEKMWSTYHDNPMIFYNLFNVVIEAVDLKLASKKEIVDFYDEGERVLKKEDFAKLPTDFRKIRDNAAKSAGK